MVRHMKFILCRILQRHVWETVWESRGEAASMLQCKRCERIGWLLP